jgi:hypothetical protein
MRPVTVYSPSRPLAERDLPAQCDFLTRPQLLTRTYPFPVGKEHLRSRALVCAHRSSAAFQKSRIRSRNSE